MLGFKKRGAGGDSLFCNKKGQLTLSLIIAIMIVVIAIVYLLFFRSYGIVSEERLVESKDSLVLSNALEEYIGENVDFSEGESVKSKYSRLLIWNFFNFVGEDPLPFLEDLREDEFAPELRVESGFGFSNEIYDFFEYDYANPEAVRKQARLLKQAGVNQVQVYLLRWSEVDSNGVPFDSHYEVNDEIVDILTEEGLEIHVEFFTHHINETGCFMFGSKENKKSCDLYSINVPADQISPIVDVVDEGLIPQFQNYVINTVRRYPQIKSWGFLNEVDSLDVDDLIILQKAYYQAVKEANPDALVGAAGPTFPELLAPKEKLHPEVSKALSNPLIVSALEGNWSVTYPDVYDNWKKFYEESRYDFVQIHQLGVIFWPDAKWIDESYDKSGNFNSNSLTWDLVKRGVDNIREMVGGVPITSQLELNSYGTLNSSEHWRRVKINFREASSGKYGFDFVDFYQMRENVVSYNYDTAYDKYLFGKGNSGPVSVKYAFDRDAEPSPLYYEIAKIYSDYSLRLSQKYVQYFFEKFYPEIHVQNGKVGIGTNNPSEKLDVEGFVKGRSGLCIGDDCRTVWPTGGTNGKEVWNSGIGGIFYNGGKVGIGTSSPRGKLDIPGGDIIVSTLGSSGSAGLMSDGDNRIDLGWGGDGGGNFELYSKNYPGRSGEFKIIYGGGDFGKVRFTHYDGRVWTDRMVINEDGNVGVGTSNPLSKISVGAGGLEGVGIYSVGSKYGMYSSSFGEAGLRSDGGYYGIFGVGKNVGVYGSGGTSGIGIYGHNSGTGVRGDGNVYDFYAGGAGTDYGTASSIRWKDNVVEIDPQIALNKILQIKGSYFNWNIYDEAHDMGFIAEELGQIVPEVVQYETDLSDSSNWYIDEKGVKRLYAEGVDYGALTPMIIQAMKGQQELIEEQKEEINLLNKKLNNICLKNNGLC